MPAKPMTQKAKSSEALYAIPPTDPKTVLRDSAAADEATLLLARNMDASCEVLEALCARQAQKQATKLAGPGARNNGAAAMGIAAASAAVASKIKKKKPSGWQAPQDGVTRAKALKDGAPTPPPGLERCWECFEDLPPASSCDWLGKGQAGERDRPGQPMKCFCRPGPHRNFPTKSSPKIYLLPLGDVSGAPAPQIFRGLLQRWFHLPVEILKPPKKDQLVSLKRDPQGAGYGPQIECPSAFSLLSAVKPKDAFVVLGYTMEDICDSAKGFGFLFGQADVDKCVGLFSFARYADDVAPDSARFLRRCGMVLCHEASHLFGIRHCVYACCIMNGSNHLDESESRPFALCPVDLRKIQLTLDQAKVGGKDTPPLDLVARERSLIEWFVKHGLLVDARFSCNVVSSLTGKPESDPAPEPAPAAAATGGAAPTAVRQLSDSSNPIIARQPRGLCVEGEVEGQGVEDAEGAGR